MTRDIRHGHARRILTRIAVVSVIVLTPLSTVAVSALAEPLVLTPADEVDLVHGRGDKGRGGWDRGDKARGGWDRGTRGRADWNRGNRGRGGWDHGDRGRGDWNRGNWNRGDRGRNNWHGGGWDRGDWHRGGWPGGVVPFPGSGSAF